MKLRLLFFAAFLSLVSCSSDDSSVSGEQEKRLKKITYYEGDTFPVRVLFFQNNKIKTLHLLVISEELGYERTEYFYNDSGLLEKTESYRDNMLYLKTMKEYDSTGRIIKNTTYFYSLEDQSEAIDSITFTYEPGKITAVSGENPANGIFYEFYVNDLDQIYSIEAYGTTTTATYDDGNLASVVSEASSSTTSCTYDNNLVPKGDYLNFYKNMYGNFEPNLVLSNSGFGLVLESSNKYLKTLTKLDETYTYQYEFDEEGYPVRRKEILNGNVVSERVIEYQ
ncbi:hypothetical protein [Flavobacterium alkalisoli]|uniref:hypothetical protein n=1 Tax=Flavobacterium alkalisoli TaxID=2602769 RepID=UPI003A8E4AAA